MKFRTKVLHSRSRLVLALAPLLVVSAMGAATLTVTSAADSGAGTLRAALVAAASGDSMVFDSTLSGATITLQNALPNIGVDLSIDGSAAPGLVVSGNDQYRVFFVNGGTVAIGSLKIAHGKAKGGKGGDGSASSDGSAELVGGGGGGAGLGGGLMINAGAVTLTRITFDSNAAVGGDGGSYFQGLYPPTSGGGGGGVDGHDGTDGYLADGGNGGDGGPFGGTGGIGGTVPGGCLFSGDLINPGDGGEGAGGGGAYGCAIPSATAGNGGFGGGGGGSAAGANLALFNAPGYGGFGGGGGGISGGTRNGGEFGGSGCWLPDFGCLFGGGGGGAGLGGAVFVREGASLTLSACLFSNNSAAGGTFGKADPFGSTAENGSGEGGALFVMDGATANQCNSTYSGNSSDVWGTVLNGCPPCPKPIGYWKNNPAAWPVNSLTLGSQSYPESTLIEILRLKNRGDASLTLADQMIAAKLNAVGNVVPAAAADAIASGDTLLAKYTGPLSYNVRPSTTDGQKMVAIAATLNDYNNALLSPGCTP